MLDQATSNSNGAQDFESLDETIEAFEASWNRLGISQIELHLPSPDHPEFESLATELFCVDLERNWHVGSARTAEEYRKAYPDIFVQCPRILERVAFEEYRIRVQLGQPITRKQYCRRLNINTDHWPEESAPSSIDSTDSQFFSCAIAQEMQRVAGISDGFPEVGERFLDFDIVERFGSGKHDHVYLAIQRTLANRLVVIKFTSEIWSESDRMARLQHTNVVPVYSVHQLNGLQAVCMPYLGKHTLATVLGHLPDRAHFCGAQFVELLRNRIGSSPDDANTHSGATIQSDEKGNSSGSIGSVGSSGKTSAPHASDELASYLQGLDFEYVCAWIVSRIAKGLAHAHDRGLLHRDLKPANILITDEGQPMILDFNLSEEADRTGQTSTVIGGTLPYMSPEHLQAMKSQGQVDVRSDVYSLGIVFYQLLAGKLPFAVPTGSLDDRLSSHLQQQLTVSPSVRDINPRISFDVDSIVQHCLALEPADRYQSAKELQCDLERHLRHFSLKYAPNRSKQEVVTKWIKRHPRLTSAGAIATAASVLIVAVLVLLLWRTQMLAKFEALESFRRFETLASIARAPLSSPTTDDAVRKFGLRRANEALSIFGTDATAVESQPHFQMLENDNQQELKEGISELHYLISFATYTNAMMENDKRSREKQLRNALAHNRMCRQLGSANQAVVFQRAGIERELGLNTKAGTAVADTQVQLTDDTSARYIMAVHNVSNGEFAKAEADLSKLLANKPKDFYAHFLLGNCHFAAKRIAEAESCFGACVALWPDNHLPFLFRGICRVEAGRFEAAGADFTQVLRLKPNDSSALVNRAIVHLDLGRFRQAELDLTLAISGGRDDSLTYILRSRAWKGLGEQEQSELDRHRAISNEPVDVEGWIQRGLIRLPDDPKSALQDIDAAIRLNPASRKALQNRAHVLSHFLHDDAQAIDTLSQLLEQYPDDATVLAARGLLRARLGRRELAHADGRRAIEFSRSPNNIYQAARIFSQTSKENEEDASHSIDLLREAFQLDMQLARIADRDPDLVPISACVEFRMLLDAAAAMSGL